MGQFCVNAGLILIVWFLFSILSIQILVSFINFKTELQIRDFSDMRKIIINHTFWPITEDGKIFCEVLK